MIKLHLKSAFLCSLLVLINAVSTAQSFTSDMPNSFCYTDKTSYSLNQWIDDNGNPEYHCEVNEVYSSRIIPNILGNESENTVIIITIIDDTDDRARMLDLAAVTIYTNPSSWSDIPDQCYSANSIYLPDYVNQPAGSVDLSFLGSHVLSDLFDSSDAEDGTYTVYFTNSYYGCEVSQSQIISVIKPSVDFAEIPDQCKNGNIISLTQASPADGIYSGLGVISGQLFDPKVAGIGTHTITYIRSIEGCTRAVSRSVDVNPLPTITLSPISDICENTGPITLTQGSPEGGIYGGPGVTEGKFYPRVAGPGTHTIEYSYSDISGCQNTATITVKVNPAPSPYIDVVAPVCENQEAINLTTCGHPEGGFFSGHGVSANYFDPSISGAGIVTIYYSINNSYGCLTTVSKDITIKEIPVISWPEYQDICIDVNTIELNQASPSGGAYSGTGVSGNFFTPTDAGPGLHELEYLYQAVNGCKSTSINSIQVNQLPDIEFTIVDSICLNHSPIVLENYSPVGGTFSGDGINENSFDPESAGIGEHTIKYSFSDANTCKNEIVDTVKVLELPNIIMTDNDTCYVNSPGLVLSGDFPTGGEYTGPAVLNNTFHPSSVGFGAHTITYTIQDIRGCVNAKTRDVVVIEQNVSLELPRNQICIHDNPIELSGGSPGGGEYSGPGVTGGMFYPEAAGVGMHKIIYRYNELGEVRTADDLINVIGKPSLPDIITNNPYCVNEEIELHSADNDELTWLTTDFQQVSTSISNTFRISRDTIIYAFYTDHNGCLSDKRRLDLETEDIVVSFHADITEAETGIKISFTNNSTAGSYLWDFSEGDVSYEREPIHYFNIPGYKTISLTVTSDNSCVDTLTQTDYILIGTVGIYKIQKSKLEAYPLPFQEYLIINSTSITGDAKFKIVDFAGIVHLDGILRGENLNRLDTRSLSKGFYLMLIEKDNYVEYLRLVK